MQYNYQGGYPSTAPAPRKKTGLSKTAVFFISFGTAFAVFAAIAAGFFLYNGAQYSQALASVENKDFHDAMDRLSSTASYYKDTPQLLAYAQAGQLLLDKKYDDAKAAFSKLGDYRDSKAMVSEADYQKAASLLDASKFDDARQIFTALKGYKDSAAMITEADYREAASFYDKKDYKDALDAYDKLGGYKDSAAKLKSVSDEVFQAAVTSYRKSDYTAAKEGFTLVKEYEPDTSKYFDLIEAHGKTVQDATTDYIGMKALFGKLTAMGNFEDAQALRGSDAFLFYWLEGNWYCSTTEITMDFHYDASEHCWYSYKAKMDWVEYKLEQGCLYYYFSDGWGKIMNLTLNSENILQVKYDAGDNAGMVSTFVRQN